MRRNRPTLTHCVAAMLLAGALTSTPAAANDLPYSTADGTDFMRAFIILPARMARALLMTGVYTAYLPLSTLDGSEPEKYEHWVAKQWNALLDHGDR